MVVVEYVWAWWSEVFGLSKMIREIRVEYVGRGQADWGLPSNGVGVQFLRVGCSNCVSYSDAQR